MKFSQRSVLLLAVACLCAGSLFADDKPTKKARPQDEQEVTVFVTGSLIPQRIKLRNVGNATTSPLRVIDRQEIDRTGRVTTAGAFVNEPSVRIIGH